MTEKSLTEIQLFAPFAGVCSPLDQVPDPAFAQKLVGDGMAVDPVEGVLHAPCDAVVQQIHPSGHAVTLMAAGNVELLVHIGVDTVKLRGDGFEPLVSAGQSVKAGTPLVAIDLDKVGRRAKSLRTVVLLTEMDRIAGLEPTDQLHLKTADLLFKAEISAGSGGTINAEGMASSSPVTIMAAMAYVTTNTLGIVHGMSFSHGFIDFVVLSANARKFWLIPIIGVLYAGIYYTVFRVLIVKLDLKTPGRGEDDISVEAGTGTERARNFIEAFGGPDNLTSVDSCITRLRMEVNDPAKVDQARLKELGASGVIMAGNGVQAILGTVAENTRTEIEEMLASGGYQAAAPTDKGEAVAADIAVSDHTHQAAEALLGRLQGLSAVQAIAHNRLRIELGNSSAVRKEDLGALGVQDVVVINEQVAHLIFADDTTALAKALEEKLAA